MPKLSIKPLFLKAFAVYKTHWQYLSLITLATFGLQFGLNYLTNQLTHPALVIPFSFISWLVNTLITLGLINFYLKLVATNQPNYKDLYSQVKLVGNIIIGSLIYGLIVLAGLILFIIPGIIFSLKFMFYSYLIIDKGLNPLEAIKKSGQITQGYKWQIFFIALISGLINILGFLPFFVGLIFTIPLTMLVMTYVYKKLNPQKLATPQAQNSSPSQ